MTQPKEEKPESVKKYLLKKILFTIVGFALITFLLIMLTIWGLNTYTQHGITVKVPSIKGQSLENAEKILSQNDLKYEVISSMYVGATPGSVIEVIPEEGEKVKKNRTVYLIIEPTTPQMISVPDLRNFSSRQALTRLKSLGFNQVTIETKPSVYKDAVIDILYGGQSINSDTKLPKTAPLVLVIGDGGEVAIDSIFDQIGQDSVFMESFEDEEIDISDNPYFE